MNATTHDLTTSQVAKLTGLSVNTIKKCFTTGRLKGYCVPGSDHRRIPRAELERFAREYDIPLADGKAAERAL